MPHYTVSIEDTAEIPAQPTPPDEPLPEVEVGIWQVEEPDSDGAVATAKALHRASYGRLPAAPRVTLETRRGGGSRARRVLARCLG